MVPYVVSAVVAVTVMHVLLYVCVLWECEGDGNSGVGSGGGVVAVSVYMGGIRGSCVLSSAGDVLEMSVVRGVCGVCDMCMCLARGGVGRVGVRGLGLGVTNPGGTGGKWDMCVFWLRRCGVGGVGGGSGWPACARVWEGGVVLSLCLL